MQPGAFSEGAPNLLARPAGAVLHTEGIRFCSVDGVADCTEGSGVADCTELAHSVGAIGIVQRESVDSVGNW